MHTRALAASRPCAVVLKDSTAWHYCGKFTSERDFLDVVDGDYDAYLRPRFVRDRRDVRMGGRVCAGIVSGVQVQEWTPERV
jgi:hypothetical protein